MGLDKEQFWKIHNKFLKGRLITESPNKDSANLSDLCKNNLPLAFEVFKKIELNAIAKLYNSIPMIEKLHQEIKECLKAGHKIIFIGCGSSARLASLLKILWHIYNFENIEVSGLVQNISAGGDIALIQAVEQFEDQEIISIQQLINQGLGQNDLLIGLSASGESIFILSALQVTASYSTRKPWLVTNNPISTLLVRNHNHPSATNTINTLELIVGEMALAGSTRLQATTAMQIALGIALLSCSTNYQNTEDNDLKQTINAIYTIIDNIPFTELSYITEYEINKLKQDKFILYQTNNSLLALTLFADIAERSPTFNINTSHHFGVKINRNTNNHYNQYDNNKMFDHVNGVDNDDLTLDKIIGNVIPQTFANKANHIMNEKEISIANWMYSNTNNDNVLNIALDNVTLIIPTTNNHLYNTLIYKVCLNTHSTLMFGQLGFFEGNLMLSVKPSNFKLIDRIIRYTQFILAHKFKKHISYKQIADAVFEEISNLKDNQSIVDNIVKKLQPPTYIDNN